MKREARWEAPSEYGYAGAIESMGSIAAPLLAGFSFALALFLLPNTRGSFWTSAALLLLVGAALAFIAAVQFTFRARQFATTPSEIEMWWRNPDEPGRREMLRRDQRFHLSNHRGWAKRASGAYDVGLLIFLLGITTSFVPPGGFRYASDGRLAVIALALAGFVVEFVWIAQTRRSGKVNLVDWPPAPEPEMES